ncbi:MAG: ABC transporter permease [Proteobacteria bacterium]|nr:ABC transporter permease [Pseudomonadota bacterium]MBI3497907.1 ABC transporter permease [Pseudomonadota bacterium]
MTSPALATRPDPAGSALLPRWAQERALPLTTVLAALTLLWYLAAIWLNADLAEQKLSRSAPTWTTAELIDTAWSLDRPVLPTPDQIWAEFADSVFNREVTSRRSLVYHATVTASASIIGFGLGIALGVLLAVGIVHQRTLDRSLLPWIIASQTVPILAIAPMIIVVLASLGMTGLLPKAVISMYLCFFPVTIGMVKGLRAPDPLELDLMATYSASPQQVFWKLRWPSSLSYLFASLKVAIAISLVGAIVGELPTGAQEGIGARLLSGSYYGQTVQIWAALLMASLLGLVLVAAVGGAERVTLSRMGGRR